MTTLVPHGGAVRSEPQGRFVRDDAGARTGAAGSRRSRTDRALDDLRVTTLAFLAFIAGRSHDCCEGIGLIWAVVADQVEGTNQETYSILLKIMEKYIFLV